MRGTRIAASMNEGARFGQGQSVAVGRSIDDDEGGLKQQRRRKMRQEGRKERGKRADCQTVSE